VITSLVITAISASHSVSAGIVTFGSGGNAFNMDFTTIGSPGNAADTTGVPNPAGAVSYTYQMGTYEVSENMITKYNANFGTANSLAITKNTRSADKPATSVSWNKAARFVNWLNTSKGYQAAYNFTTNGVNDDIALWSVSDAGYDSANLFRNSLATYVLPSMDEWYKAAFYNPVTSTYGDYATANGSVPTAVASGTVANTAVYGGQSGPADITLAGGLSAFGVMGLNGNVLEWEETSGDLNNSSGSSSRGFRGGFWADNSNDLSSSVRVDFISPGNEGDVIGFRVASLSSSAAAVPEPASCMVWSVMGLAGWWYRGRRRK